MSYKRDSHLEMILPPVDIWQYLVTFLVVTTEVEGTGVLLARGQSQGYLLNILKCTGKPLKDKNHPAPSPGTAGVESP